MDVNVGPQFSDNRENLSGLQLGKKINVFLETLST